MHPNAQVLPLQIVMLTCTTLEPTIDHVQPLLGKYGISWNFFFEENSKRFSVIFIRRRKIKEIQITSNLNTIEALSGLKTTTKEAKELRPRKIKSSK